MSLTAAEAMVLLEPTPDSGIPAAKVTLLALLAEGVLKQQPSAGRVFGSTTRLVLTRQPAENPPHVAAVLDAVRDSKSATVADIASRLSIATNGFASFVPALVRPRLVQRGLLVERRHQAPRRVLLFFRRTVTIRSWHPTAAGAREQTRLRGMLDTAPAIRALLDEDRSRAAAMAASLGVLIVLVPLPLLGQMTSAMALHNPPDSSGSGDAGGDFSWASSLDAISADIDSSFDRARSDAASDSNSYSNSDSGSFSGPANSFDSVGSFDSVSSDGGGGE